MTAKPASQRKADERARKREKGLIEINVPGSEVRWLTRAQAKKVASFVRRVAGES